MAGAPAAWLVAYMVAEYGPDEVKTGFGAGLAASSLVVGAQGATELEAGVAVSRTGLVPSLVAARRLTVRPLR